MSVGLRRVDLDFLENEMSVQIKKNNHFVNFSFYYYFCYLSFLSREICKKILKINLFMDVF